MAELVRNRPRGGVSGYKVLGITQRATPLAFSWVGDMRIRFTDFQVNEIGLDGKVVHLRTVGLTGEQKQAEGITGAEETESKAAREEAEPVNEKSEQQPATPPPAKVLEISAEDVKILSDLAGETFAHDIVDMFREAQTADQRQRVKPVTSEPISDKQTRGQIHQEVRRIFQSKIDTSTDGNGGIVATAIRGRPRGRKRNRGGGEPSRDNNQIARHRQPEKRPVAEFLHFTLYKENRDTMDAVSTIARMIRAKPQMIGYAGTKDRRASTAQRCSIRYTRQKSLASLNGKIWGIKTGDYEYRDEPIHLGQLLGNEFVITLKKCKLVGADAAVTTAPIAEQVKFLQESVGSSLRHMADHGWINYFGHQRFGTHEIGTHEIGKLILSDRYKEAVDALLFYDPEIASQYDAADDDDGGKPKQQPDARTNPDDVLRHHACMLFRTGKDASRAVSLLPRRFSAERCVMRHLTRAGAASMRDYVGSLTHITRGLRSMYLHAYQSHVWNHAASVRWERHGAAVVEGDLVVAESEPVPVYGGKDEDGDDIINPVVDGGGGGGAGEGGEDGEDGDQGDVVDDDNSGPVRARPLSAEEAASGRYTIHDVVLPTPGHDVVYPANDVGLFYAAFMGRAENGGLDPHSMRRMRREFSLPGRYRKLTHRFLAAPSVLFRAYTDDKEQMHPTDLDVIAGAATAAAVVAGEGEGREPAAKKERLAEGGGEDEVARARARAEPAEEQIAAVVKFQLGRSAYATIALRELMGDLQDE